MPPKKGRNAAVSTSSTSYDKKKFLSLIAYERYKKMLVAKPIIPERGLQIPENVSPGIYSNIVKRKWQELVKQPEPAIIPMVREFYANVEDHDNFKAFIRGKWIRFDSAAINSYYKLPNINNDAYTQYIKHELNLTEVIQTIARPGASWVGKNNDTVKLKSSDLSSSKKAWMSFICAKLIPAKHHSDLTRERAILLYAIISGKSIDVGKVIQDSIIHCMGGTTSGGLLHPSLICGLCIRGGVTFQADEELQHPLGVINRTIFEQFSSWEFPYIRKRRKASCHTSSATNDNEAGPSVPTTNSTPNIDSVPERMLLVEQSVQQNRRQLSILSKKVDAFMKYVIDFNTCLATMFNQSPLNSCDAFAVEFPPPPMFPEDPPVDFDNDDANS